MTEHAFEARQGIHDQTGKKHPDEYQNDLNPNTFAGQNNPDGPHPERDAPGGDKIKALHDMLPDLTTDQLRELVVLPEGTTLEQGAVYIDLKNLPQGEFKATSDMTVKPGSYIVPKSEVDYELWNYLRGVRDPERTGVGT